MKETIKNVLNNQVVVWTTALIIGCVIGYMGNGWISDAMTFIATVFTRLFQFLAVPTIAISVITTLATLSGEKRTGKIFLRTITFTILTTLCAAAVGLVLYLLIQPENLPKEIILGTSSKEELMAGSAVETSYMDHILSVIPSNMIQPFLSGNVLSILLVSLAIGLGISSLRRQPESKGIEMLLEIIQGLQSLLFCLIRALIKVLPIGIVGFAAQLGSQVEGGVIIGSLGSYTLVIIAANLIQFFVVLPLFLLLGGLNPLKVLRGMSRALMMAFFTKSSAATLPVTIRCSEEQVGVRAEVARFVLPICCTVNMNGCATFILVTSMFIMQNGGTVLDAGGMLSWLLISTISAIGNAGVPMGCYFLTLSLMAGMNAPAIGILGIILPIYTIIDMVETAENVWSDSCVAALTNKTLGKE